MLAGDVEVRLIGMVDVCAMDATFALASAEVGRLLDAELPRDALLLVSDRLHVSYFHIYTRRRPLVTEYLDASPETLRQRFALTSLSLRIYSPQLDSAAITAARASWAVSTLLSRAMARKVLRERSSICEILMRITGSRYEPATPARGT